ncbi:MAG: GIY-YIG nuclease family protein [Elusimicrobiota bacterium]|nr:GIY-YIG nuclease family protein [Endomicrobiia bacterium]MDW8165442.1 GIY-YIG nuclease family protein [Elusimicrobiota bacterium]
MTEELNYQIKNIPKLPGVYLMRDASGKIVYVGKAKNLYSRIRSYFVKNEDFRLIGVMFYSIKNIDYIVCGSEKEALILEQKLIKKLQPQYNIIWRDDKSYLMIYIDKSDIFPKLNFIRYKEYLNKQKTQKSKSIIYFGPYPSAKQIKSVVRFITKLFKIRRCKYDSKLFFNPQLKNKFTSCIYYQTKQCVAPCILATYPEKKKEIEATYKNLIKNVILFLKGRNKKLIDELKSKMKYYSDNLNFEQAIILRDTINYLSNIFSKCIIKQIEEKDILDITIQKIEVLKKLKEKLNLKSIPVIIEAIDISTFQGVGSCGSVVRFVNGYPDKQSYRRYKIKTLNEFQVDDYTMIKEVVERRYKRLLNEKKELPNLLIIDGGKGQLNVAFEVLKENNLQEKIDIISIAKNEDRVYTLNTDLAIFLSTSEEDNLLRYIRDEAHRFAIKYNKVLLRKKLKI